jgi:undecaprenyl diphosphate synthase
MPAVSNDQPDYEALKSALDPARLPAHVAIIMDGNGRWAKKGGFVRLYGHREGYKNVRRIVRAAGEFGIRVLTLYVFSVENWKRSKAETDALMMLIEQAARNETRDLNSNGVCIRFLGRRRDLPASVIAEMDKAVASTSSNTGLVLNLAVNYGGRAEIADSVRAIAEKVKSGELSPEEITEETIRSYTYAPDLPDPDLIIRTAGEMRLSNFLLWGSAYSEFWTTSVFWPDFNESLLVDALADYQKRVRKFGTVTDL